MAQLGGFFAVSYVAETVFTDALDESWKLRWADARGTVSYAVATPIGQLLASGAASLDKPSVALVGQANSARVRLSLACRLELRLDGVAVGGAFLQTDITVDVPILLVQEQSYQKASVDLSQFVLSPGQLQVTWYDGPSDPRAANALMSDESRQQLTDELRRRAEPYVKFSIPSDLIWAAELAAMTAGGPGSIVVTPLTKFGGVRILDGWIAVGIDDTAQSTTHGNLAAIGPPPALVPGARNSNVILVIEPAILQTYLNLNAKIALKLGVASHSNLHTSGEPAVSFHDDLVEIVSVGTVDAPDPFPGTLPFSATIKVTPYLTYSGYMNASISPDIHVDAPWYLDVLGGIANFFGADVYAKLRRANQASSATLFKSQAAGDVPGMPGMRAGIRIELIMLRPDLVALFLSAGTSVTAKEPPSVVQLQFLPGAVHIRERFVRLSLSKFWSQLLIADPTYRLRYVIRRGSTNAVVVQGVAWSGTTDFGESIDLWDPANYLETSFSAEVSVERPPGTVLQHTGPDTIKINDLFDRAHPFARWQHLHQWFDMQSVPPQWKEMVRMSAVHKTAVRERCRFGDKGSTPHPERYMMQALDTLPAPDNPAFLGKLCTYCFRQG